MIGVHANRCFSGWGVSACYLRGYHDPDILFYRGSGALNQEWHWISVTFCCLTHLLHLNYSVDETTQHQSRRGFCTTRDCETLHLSLCINQVCVRTRVPECKRARVFTQTLIHRISVCMTGPLSHNWPRITGHWVLGTDLGTESCEKPPLVFRALKPSCALLPLD